MPRKPAARRLGAARWLAWALWLAPAAHACPGAGAKHLQLPLKVGGHAVVVEVAASPEARTLGLMHRARLPRDCGMLFVFPRPGRYAMWMANTPIPLSVAFLDRNGAVINIAEMRPFATDSHPSAGPALYAIEMNRGWFSQRGIGPGDRVEGLSRAPAGK